MGARGGVSSPAFLFLKNKIIVLCVCVCVYGITFKLDMLFSVRHVYVLFKFKSSLNDEKYAEQSMVEMVLLTSLQIRELYCFLTKEVSDYNQEIAQPHTADQSRAP